MILVMFTVMMMVVLRMRQLFCRRLHFEMFCKVGGAGIAGIFL